MILHLPVFHGVPRPSTDTGPVRAAGVLDSRKLFMARHLRTTNQPWIPRPLASGMSEDDLLRDFPDLTREDILACLAFAAGRERRLVAVGGR